MVVECSVFTIFCFNCVFKVLIFKLFVYGGELPCESSAHGIQKKVLDALELEYIGGFEVPVMDA